MMKTNWGRQVLMLLLSGSLAFAAVANVAYPGIVRKQQADGKMLSLRLYGDEHFHYATDENGYLIGQKRDGNYYYATMDSRAKLQVGNSPVGSLHKLMHYSQIPQEAYQVAQQRRSQQMRQLAAHASAPKASLRSATTTVRQLVLLVEFPDCKFASSHGRDAFQAMLNEPGYKGNAATGSAYDYFYENSMQQFSPSFDVYGPYMASKQMAAYGANDSITDNDTDPYSLMIEALEAAVADGVDLSLYDANNDRILDNVFVFYAGYSEAEGGDENTIWPHASSLYYQNKVYNGIRAGSYACTAELNMALNTLAGIGTFCHEYSHVLGLWDVYDTDYEESGGTSRNFGTLSLMSSGSYNNYGRTPCYLTAEERQQLGWYTIPVIKAEDKYSLKSIGNNEAYRINTDTDNEYFVLEYRTQERWDQYISGEGLIIYHVDKSNNLADGIMASQRWLSNTANASPLHPCMYVVDASNTKGINVDASSFYPTDKGNNAFSYKTTPAAVSWSGMPLKYGVSEISCDGTTASFRTNDQYTVVHVAGVVSCYDGSPLVYAEVMLTPVEEQESSKVSAGLRLAKVGPLRSAKAYTCRSNSQGQYGFYDIPAGDYLLTCLAGGDYLPFSKNISLTQGAYRYDIDIRTEVDQYFHNEYHWYDKSTLGYYGIGAKGQAMLIGSRWESAQLKDAYGDIFGSVTMYVSAGKPDLECLILEGDTTVLAYQTIENAPEGNNVFNFMEDSVVLMPNTDYVIAVQFSDYDNTAYPIGVDAGPAVDNYGNLIWNSETKTWLSLKTETEMDYNWGLSFMTCIQKDYVPVSSVKISQDSLELRMGQTTMLYAMMLPAEAAQSNHLAWSSSDASILTVNGVGMVQGLNAGEAYVYVTPDKGLHTDSCKVRVSKSTAADWKVQASQHQLLVRWSAAKEDNWKLRFAPMSNLAQVDSLLLDEPMACLSNLEAGTSYKLTLYAYRQTELCDSLVKVVNTSAANGNYPSLFVPSSLTEGDAMLLDVLNLKSSYESLSWSLDGEAITSSYLPSLSAGEHLLKVQIRYSSTKGTETIIRYIQVNNSK